MSMPVHGAFFPLAGICQIKENRSMKHMIRTAILLFALSLLPARPALALSDVDETAWYAPSVAYCVEHGLMLGVSPDTFDVDGVVTRAQLVTVLHRLAGSPEAAEGDLFLDVEKDAWYEPAIRWARETGVTNGVSPQYFGADTPLTREQLAVFFFRFAGSPPERGELPDGDAGEVSSWAGDAAAWAVAAGVMRGVSENRFAPGETVTRAQLATALTSFAQRFPSLLGTKAFSGLCAPVNAAVAPDGALLVTDSYGRVVRRFLNGGSSVYAGSAEGAADLYEQPYGGYNDASYAESLFRSPWGIAPFLGGWAVSDAENNAVRLLRGERVETINASEEGNSGGGTGFVFSYPTGLAADGDGNLYVADTRAGCIRRITPEGKLTTEAEGLSDPMGLCWYGGVLYCAEAGANRVVVIRDGKAEPLAGSGESGLADGAAADALFSAPQGIAADADGSVYIADTANGVVRRLRGGLVETLAPEEAGGLISPAGLLLHDGTLYICDPFAKKLVTVRTNP